MRKLHWYLIKSGETGRFYATQAFRKPRKWALVKGPYKDEVSCLAASIAIQCGIKPKEGAEA